MRRPPCRTLDEVKARRTQQWACSQGCSAGGGAPGQRVLCVVPCGGLGGRSRSHRLRVPGALHCRDKALARRVQALARLAGLRSCHAALRGRGAVHHLALLALARAARGVAGAGEPLQAACAIKARGPGPAIPWSEQGLAAPAPARAAWRCCPQQVHKLGKAGPAPNHTVLAPQRRAHRLRTTAGRPQGAGEVAKQAQHAKHAQQGARCTVRECFLCRRAPGIQRRRTCSGRRLRKAHTQACTLRGAAGTKTST